MRIAAARCCAFALLGALTSQQARAHVHISDKPRLSITLLNERLIYEASFPIAFFDALTGGEREDPDFVTANEQETLGRLFEQLFKEKNPVTVDGLRIKPVLQSLEFLPARPGGEGGVHSEGADAATLGLLGAADVAIEDKPDGGQDRDRGDGQMAGLFGETPTDAPRSGDEVARDRGMWIANGSVKGALSYGTKGLPSRLSIVWEIFPRHGPAAIDEVAATIIAFNKIEDIKLSRSEPEYIWHGPRRFAKRDLLAVERKETARTLGVPVLSLVLLAGLPIALVLARRRAVPDRALLAVGVVVTVLATAMGGVARVDVKLGGSSITIPGEQEAAAIFESLHKNIYRAFDYVVEDDIYDALAQSVDGKLLDEVYYEVFESLIMRDQGGAVCRIEEVKILDTRFKPEADPVSPTSELAFGITCLWRVKGSVHHWGHTHTRVNEYRAEYTVEPSNAAWKITAAQVLAQRRIADTLTWDKPEDSGTPARCEPGSGMGP